MIASLIIIVFIGAALISPSPTFKNDKFLNSGRGREAKYICLLPPYPQHGKYTVSNHPFATPGDSYPCVKLDITCEFEYIIGNATNSIFCINGEWSAAMPKCLPNSAFCTLNDDLKVEYHCSSHPRTLEHSQECPSLVPTGTVVRPICRSPAYFSLRVLPEMHCKDGIWDYKPICKPACGLITQHRKLEVSSTKHVELPWHAAIYKKWPESCYYTCSGSLITANKIISAATCVTGVNEELPQVPETDLLVAVNKMYDDYNDPRDVNSQESTVIDIKIPLRYRGIATNYENNIAIVVVERPFIFHLSVRPVCLDFNNNLDRTQLTEGNSGRVAQWRTDNNNDQTSRVLNVDDVQNIKYEDCYEMLQTKYRRYLTNDIFCAASNDTWRRSHYDFGAGVAFLESTTQRYYLRGVASYFTQTKNNTLYIFTSVVKHEDFIKQYIL